MPTPHHPLTLGSTVINLADVRAQRLAALDVAQAKEAEANQEVQLSARQKVFYRNMQFFAHRLATDEYGDFGRVAYKVGQLDGELALHFISEPYEAFYPLDLDYVIDFSIDPLITRWSVAQACEYGITPRDSLTFTEISE